MSNPLLNALLHGRAVFQATQVQPTKASVEKVEFKAHSLVLFDKARAGIHATTAMLSAPAWGSTKPTDFISIAGHQPIAPVIIQVPTIAGSNAPQGGIQ